MKTPYILEIHSVKVAIFAYFGIRGLNENSSGDLLLNMSYRIWIFLKIWIILFVVGEDTS